MWFCGFVYLRVLGLYCLEFYTMYRAAFTQHRPALAFSPCVTAGNKWCTQLGYCYQSNYSQKRGKVKGANRGFWSIQILGGDCYYFKTPLRAGAVDKWLPHRKWRATVPASTTRKHREWEALLGFRLFSPLPLRLLVASPGDLTEPNRRPKDQGARVISL